MEIEIQPKNAHFLCYNETCFYIQWLYRKKGFECHCLIMSFCMLTLNLAHLNTCFL